MLSLLDRTSAKLTQFRDSVRERVRLRLLRGTADLINWLEGRYNALVMDEPQRPSRYARLLADRNVRRVRR